MVIALAIVRPFEAVDSRRGRFITTCYTQVTKNPPDYLSRGGDGASTNYKPQTTYMHYTKRLGSFVTYTPTLSPEAGTPGEKRMRIW